MYMCVQWPVFFSDSRRQALPVVKLLGSVIFLFVFAALVFLWASFIIIELLSDAVAQGVQPDQIIFTDVAMKNEHIRRSSLADLFLDT